MSELLAYTIGNPAGVPLVDQWRDLFQRGFIFIAPAEYDLTVESLVLDVWRDLYETDGTFVCSVYEVENNEPTGDAVQTQTFTKSDIGDPGDRADMTLTFSSITISAGDSKAFIFTYPDYVKAFGVGPQDGNRIGTYYWSNPILNFGIGYLPVINSGSGWQVNYAAWLSKIITGTATPFDPNPPSPPPSDVPAFPPAKPALPNADPWWNPPDPSGSSPPGPLPPYWATGGGGYQKNLVVSGNNKIYYEPHTEFTVPYTP